MPMGDEIVSEEDAKRIILALYDRGYGLAAYIIERILGSQIAPDEKEDLLQESFLRLVSYVEQLRDRTPREQLAYLARVVRTVAIDEARRRNQMRWIDSLDSPNSPEPESPDLSPEEFCMMRDDITEKLANMRAALARLSERDRTLLIEKYQNGRSDAEIGMILGIKTRNIRVYLARARHKAAIYYGEEIDGKKKQKHRDDVGANDQIVRKKKSKGI